MSRRMMLAGSVLVLILAAVSLTALAQGLIEMRSPEVPPAQDGGWLLISAFVLLMVLPFVPGLLEVAVPRDRYPLPIDLEYTKDPRYMGRSARRLLLGGLGDALRDPGRHKVTLSKPEVLEIHDGLNLADNGRLDLLTWVRGDAVFGKGARCEEDIHVDGGVTFGDESFLRSVVAQGDIELGKGVHVVRWIDSDGDIVIGRDSTLGISAASGGSLRLGDGSKFRRLWGSPILTEGHDGAPPKPQVPSAVPRHDATGKTDIDDHVTRHDGDLLLDLVTNDPVRPLVVRGDCEIGDGVVFRAPIKVYGGIKLGKGAVVLGDIFAENDVVLGEGSVVEGNVFTQSAVWLGRGARVGSPARRTSVVARKNVTLGGAAAVYGYVLTDGAGEVACGER